MIQFSGNKEEEFHSSITLTKKEPEQNEVKWRDTTNLKVQKEIRWIITSHHQRTSKIFINEEFDIP